jgi:hypothetical protein
MKHEPASWTHDDSAAQLRNSKVEFAYRVQNGIDGSYHRRMIVLHTVEMIGSAFAPNHRQRFSTLLLIL